ncbi:MAG: glycine betaine ABC transporter substrate-binding protein, partial [Chloroflexota bacterium]
VLALLVGACSTGGGSKPTVKIGSVKFDEAKVMAEIYAQALEAKGYTVNRDGIGLGDRAVLAPAIENGQIDLQPEYIGSRLSYEGGSPTANSAQNRTELQALLEAKNLSVFAFTPAQDVNAFVVRADTATQFNLTRISDTAAVQDQLNWGLALDCPTNALCGAPGGALAQYGITAETIAAATLLSACDTPMADALKAGTIDLGELCSTQADILANNWVVLEDDLHSQPAENIAPIVRDALLEQLDNAGLYDEFQKALNDVSVKIDIPTLMELNRQIAFDHKDPADVARTWLTANGFVQ